MPFAAASPALLELGMVPWTNAMWRVDKCLSRVSLSKAGALRRNLFDKLSCSGTVDIPLPWVTVQQVASQAKTMPSAAPVKRLFLRQFPTAH